MTELVSVIVIISIISVYAAAKLSSSIGEEYVVCREIATSLRLVQNININQGNINTNGIYFISRSIDSNSVWGLCDNSLNECSIDSVNQWKHKTVNKNVNVSDSLVFFNMIGQLDKKANNIVTVSSGEANCKITIDEQGDISWK